MAATRTAPKPLNLADATGDDLVEGPRSRARKRRGARHTAYRAGRAVGRHGFRHRRRLAPLAAVTALAIAGAVLSVPDDGWKTALAIDGLGAGLYLRAAIRQAKSKKPPTRSQMLWSAAGAGTAGGLLLEMALTCGPLPPNTGLLAVWLGVFGTRWWYRHRIRPGATVGTGHAARWAQKIAAPSAALPGSTLANITDLPGAGWSATIRLNGMRQSTANAKNSTTQIAAAFGLPVTSVAIDNHPSGAANLAVIQVYETNPLITVPVFPGPSVLDPATGIAHIGLHVDGTPAQYQMWIPKWGAVHDFITGATGSGKSGLITLLFAIERHSGLCISWGGDPQNGKSFGYWMDYLDYFASGVDEIMGMLLAADAELDRRSQSSAAEVWYDADGDAMYGDTEFTPSAEPDGEKLLVITIDEWEHVWEAYPQALAIAERIATEGRKCGIKLRLAAHLPTLASLGEDKLRQPLVSGNVIALRTSSKSSSYVIDLPADPNDIQKSWPDMPGSRTSGLGYLKSVEGRAATFRGWCPEPREVATRWAKTGAPATLGAEARENCGPVYTEWRERLAARRRGENPVVPGVTDIPEDSELDETATSGTATKGPSLAGRTTGTGTLEAQIAAQQKPLVGAKKQAIVDYLRRVGSSTTGLIIKATNVPEGTASSTLGRLEKEGHVIRISQGVWAATALEDEAAA